MVLLLTWVVFFLDVQVAGFLEREVMSRCLVSCEAWLVSSFCAVIVCRQRITISDEFRECEMVLRMMTVICILFCL
ncbi:hypothetical protein V8F33_000267 [Rhypophila sp. PSN 637]